ncbi:MULTISPECIES: AMP-binding protein [unclassified Nocardioides]|uniref:class I adenylate-forming enzyme family protein n=1 Tax=unclassified Nocardioides TaxID=2615069 RepID=UPI00005702BE|nr:MULTISPECIES: AMP-binding protein [unclassified Nocardioides]ABL83593.1 AMP-dependent synthetase and ligase [Nocardioides sp. JS614]
MPISPGGAQLNIANGVREFARGTPRQPAVIDGERMLTYAQLGDRAARLANALVARGVRPGEHVAVCVGNRLEHPEIACGIAMAGLVIVPLNPRYTEPEARYIIEHSGARAVITEAHLASVVTPAAADQGAFVVVLGTSPDFESYDEVLAASSPEDPEYPVDETEPFCIAYTSGTTGRPKGVMISHRSRALTFYQAATEWGLGTGRTSLAVAPMYHGAGFAFGYAPVFTGGTVVMLPKWSPEQMLELAERHRVQSIFLVPAHAQMLRRLGGEAIATRDLSSLDTLYFNAAALPFELKKWVIESFPGAGVHELYGSTESGIITNLRPVDMLRKPGSVGQPWFMTEIRVVDLDGAPVGPGGMGELYSRSPYLMLGYYNDPDATARCTSEDGFVTCGDLVRLDDEGYVHIVGRSSDMIVSGGINIYPREVEDVLARHPSVTDVAVVGRSSEEWGEEVTAYVVLASGVTLDVESLEAHCRESLAGYKIPRRWHVIGELPRNAAGKVVKRDIPD